MSDKKRNPDDGLKEMLQLIEKIEKMDEEEGVRRFKIKPPYSSGKRPEPPRWEDVGIQHKLA